MSDTSGSQAGGMTKTTPETRFIRRMEKVSRLLIVRVFIYVMAGLYALKLVLTLISPSGATPGYWLGVARQTAQDGSFLAGLLVIQRYCANYTARRASLSLRRRDTATLCLLLLVVSGLDTSWPHGIFFAVPFCAVIYFWELRNIRRDERNATSPTT